MDAPVPTGQTFPSAQGEVSLAEPVFYHLCFFPPRVQYIVSLHIASALQNTLASPLLSICSKINTSFNESLKAAILRMLEGQKCKVLFPD